MFLRSGARPPAPTSTRVSKSVSLYHHRMHHIKNPRSPCVCPFFVFVFGLCLCLPVASARAGQCFRRSLTHLPCVPVTCPMCTHDWHASLYRPVSHPSQAPIPNRRAPSPFPRHTRSHHHLHTSARSRTRASDAESLIQSTLGTGTTTVTDGTSIQVAALWSVRVGSVDLGHPLSISAAQFRARVSALPCFVLLCSALS